MTSRQFQCKCNKCNFLIFISLNEIKQIKKRKLIKVLSLITIVKINYICPIKVSYIQILMGKASGIKGMERIIPPLCNSFIIYFHVKRENVNGTPLSAILFHDIYIYQLNHL